MAATSHIGDNIELALKKLSISDTHDSEQRAGNLPAIAGLQDVVESLRELIGARVALCRVHVPARRQLMLPTYGVAV